MTILKRAHNWQDNFFANFSQTGHMPQRFSINAQQYLVTKTVAGIVDS
jgi:hypothetical protein